MIVESLLDVVFKIASGILEMLPDISWNVDNSFFNAFFDVLRMVCYLLPMPTVIAIIYLVICFTAFRIIISLVKTIWDLIPLL